MYSDLLMVECARCRIAREGIVAQLRNPSHAFAQKVRAINYGDCYFFRPLTVEALDNIDPERACAHFNQSFQNPAEFHLVLTDNLQVNATYPHDCHSRLISMTLQSAQQHIV